MDKSVIEKSEYAKEMGSVEHPKMLGNKFGTEIVSEKKALNPVVKEILSEIYEVDVFDIYI